MTIVFSAALGHAPGWVAWPERAPEAQRLALDNGIEQLKRKLEEARPDAMIVFTSEHFTNFFLEHASAYCVGRGEMHRGPVEPWMRMERTVIPGDPDLAREMVHACYAADFETSFSYELLFDHGTLVPLKHLTPGFSVPVVPVFFNTLVAPQPSPQRCFKLGQVIGKVARASSKRIALIATGGMSHDPGERRHGWIDEDLDRQFLERMENGDVAALQSYSISQLAASGAGTVELIAWIALAGALQKFSGKTIAYEPVVEWATGMGIIELQAA